MTVIKARQGVELITSGELVVVDANGAEVPHDGETLGEIVVRGNAVMQGYFNDPQATAAAIRDGWFHTGDAAVVHVDGYVEIRDRFKDVIISGAETHQLPNSSAAILHRRFVSGCYSVGSGDSGDDSGWMRGETGVPDSRGAGSISCLVRM